MEGIRNRKLLILGVLLIILTAYTYMLRYRQPAPAPVPRLDLIPESIDGYSSHPVRISEDALRVLGADTTLARIFTEGPIELEFFLGFFRQQQQNSQIHSPKHCYPGSGWDIIRETSLELNPRGSKLTARSILISDGDYKRLVIYWFSLNGRFVTNEFALKWHQMKSSLLGRTQGAAFIRFSAVLPPGREEEAKSELKELAEKIYPHIERSFENSGQGSSG